ncbi:c-type cytochrome [Methylacidiphilum caldifontis]|uniref:Cytochrome C n=1 Tax=Methylacidiphilum caldifontis TaxID=2795386 RepID=A0A4Y8PCG3_9BACT|nr:c-type cytochrome [Methylacidiphilum caldifontis]TFE68930.1 cytochrome C [Methylacidiphilum caldifontis]
MLKRIFYGLCLLLLLFFVMLFLFGYFLIRQGFTARSNPPALEKVIATTALSLSIPKTVKEMKNPIPFSQEVLMEARDHFADHCALCHGNNGSGETTIGKNLYPKPGDLRSREVQKKSDGEIYYIIHNGIRWTGMPAWGEKDQDEDSWKLVHFIRHLPYLTKEEEKEMEKMNPISPHEIQEEKEEEKFLEEDNSLGNSSEDKQQNEMRMEKKE